jgi:cation diffusion facilitator family transporter
MNTPYAQTLSRYRDGLAVMWLSLGVNIVLAVLKITVGIYALSQALVADGLHSLADLAGDIAALVGLNLASKPGDEDHPYGHHKFANMACLFVAVMLLAFCGLLIWNSAHNLREHATEVPDAAALWVALFALVAKESFYRYASRQARILKLRVLAASALDHRADALASLLAVVAILVARVWGPSWAFMDKAVGLALGGYLAVQGLKIFWQASADLLDTAPGKEMVNDLREHILAVPGAAAYHQFRVRRVGDLFEVDLHLQVDRHLSVEEGHDIARKVKKTILEHHPEVIEVLIHLEPAVAEHLKDKGVHDIKVAK